APQPGPQPRRLRQVGDLPRRTDPFDGRRRRARAARPRARAHGDQCRRRGSQRGGGRRMSSIAARTGGAPISWGVCEAPDWGIELPADRVLSEMRELGLTATELGPTGYLGARAADVRALLDRHGLRLIGGFLPVPMHVCTDADLAEAQAAMRTLAEAGSEVVVLAARSADGSYDRKVRLTNEEWPVLLATLRRLQDLAAGLGLRASLHPHVGTAIEDRVSVLRLAESSDVPLCLDTGHLLIGGTDPLELVKQDPGRI